MSLKWIEGSEVRKIDARKKMSRSGKANEKRKRGKEAHFV